MGDLTADDCGRFDSYMAKWQRLLNLNDWRIERSGRRSKKYMCEVNFNDDARLATYTLGVNFGAAEVTPEALEATALHEMLHVLLHDALKADPASLEGVEHRVINVLEKLLTQGAHV